MAFKFPNIFEFLKKKHEIGAFILFSCALMQILSLVTFSWGYPENNLLGFFGHVLAWFWYVSIGLCAFPLFIALMAYAVRHFFVPFEEIFLKKRLAIFFAIFSTSMLLTVLGTGAPQVESTICSYFKFPKNTFHIGGLCCYFLYKGYPPFTMEKFLNTTGTVLLSSTLLLASIAYLVDFSWNRFLQFIRTYLQWYRKQKVSTPVEEIVKPFIRNKREIEPKEILKLPSYEEPPKNQLIKREKSDLTIIEAPVYEIKPQSKNILTKKAPQEISTIYPNYTLPREELLSMPKKYDQGDIKKELKEKADLLEETLLSFGIEAKVGQILCGPRITCFEVHPAVGVKIGRIKTLEHDIALNLEAKSIRIIAPIPGKAAVGVEVPNHHPQEVCFRELLNYYNSQNKPFRIPMLLGKAVNGDIIMTDLTKMPHCIIAGATGSGKSVCINSIVMSIMMTSRPDEVRLLMIDPKKVELTPYTEIPHMLAPVITDPEGACTALKWLVREMEKRYEILKVTGQRNIESFNKRTIDKERESKYPFSIPEKLTYYVAIIDELADLMMVATQDIETPIARIAQMARAVGIHLILATQRPSREVITGLIKANFPARIAFKVANRVNSQIILDETGADLLLGNGDMLLQLPGLSYLSRAQGVFVRDEEIQQVIEHVKSQAPCTYIINSFEEMASYEAKKADLQEAAKDSLFDEAKNIVLSTGTASTTFLQRKLRIGYARAASLMDELESHGVVGPVDGAKPRKVFFQKANTNQPSDEEEYIDAE